MPFLIKPVFPEWTNVGVSLMIALTVKTFEIVGTWLSLLYLELKGIYFKICFAVLSEMSVMFSFV